MIDLGNYLLAMLGGFCIVAPLYLIFFGGLEWAIKRDEPQVPRYTGLANQPREKPALFDDTIR